MVDHMDTEVFASRSTSPPSSPASRTGVTGDFGCREFQDTVPFDDEMVLDSPLLETPFQMLINDTELVDVEDCVDEETLENTFESDVEVVDDSEDDVAGTGREIIVAGVSDLLLESDASNDHECQTGKQGSDCGTMIFNEENDPSRCIADIDIPQSRLNFLDSQEPGESTQADALHYVDHLLMDKDLNASPLKGLKNTVRMKSPPFSGAKGRQTLATRIKTSTPTRRTRIFDWIGNDRREIRDPPDSPITSTKSKFCKSREDHIADDDTSMKKWSIDQEVIKDSTHPVSRYVKSSYAEHHRTEQASEMNRGDTFITQMDVQLQDVALTGELEPEADLLDVGINTQIAAEAMGALLYGAHASYSEENACASGPSSFQENLSENVECNATKPNTENSSFSGRNGEILVSSALNIDHPKLVGGWATSKKVERRAKAKRSRTSITGKLHRNNSSHASKSSYKSACKLNEHKSAKTADSKSSRQSEIHQKLLIPAEFSSLDKTLPKGAHLANQIMHSVPVSISEMWDQNSSLSKRNDDIMDNRSQKRNRSGSAIAPLEKRNSKRKNTSTQVSGITCPLNLDEWKHPRGKRSRSMRRHHGSASKPCGASLVTVETGMSTVYDGCQNSNGHPTISASLSVKLDDMVTLASELKVSLNEKRQTSCSRSDVADNHLDFTNLAFPWRTRGEGHKNPCLKTVSRSSFLKELARLGGPGNAADIMWKDLRRRRNLGHVRVLFSQHLDDDTIKQQKKITVRLGVSLASASADATHFIADKFARTKNMLEAMAIGKPVVTHLWLESCGQVRCLIDEKDYILRDSKKEKEIGFCMPTCLTRARECPLLKGVKVCITPNIKPDRGMIADLVRASHGQVVEISQTNGGRIHDDVLILSCEEDGEICLPFINQGVAIYTSELVLNGIVIQKLEYARHRLFADVNERNQRNVKLPASRPFCYTNT